MSIMTEEQVKLLHKLQMAEIPAFKNINPLTLFRRMRRAICSA